MYRNLGAGKDECKTLHGFSLFSHLRELGRVEKPPRARRLGDRTEPSFVSSPAVPALRLFNFVVPRKDAGSRWSGGCSRHRQGRHEAVDVENFVVKAVGVVRGSGECLHGCVTVCACALLSCALAHPRAHQKFMRPIDAVCVMRRRIGLAGAVPAWQRFSGGVRGAHRACGVCPKRTARVQ